MDFVTSTTNLAAEMSADANVKAFGLNQIDAQPMQVLAKLLPPPKLFYSGSKVSNIPIRLSYIVSKINGPCCR